jgi:hypothetical protein
MRRWLQAADFVVVVAVLPGFAQDPKPSAAPGKTNIHERGSQAHRIFP